MIYLDLSPMIAALRECPDEFELRHGWLRHLPSNHCFRIDCKGNVTLDAACGCALLSLNLQQLPDLCAAFDEWETRYWKPTLINKRFAAHFKRPSPWKRFLRKMLDKLGARAQSPGAERGLLPQLRRVTAAIRIPRRSQQIE